MCVRFVDNTRMGRNEKVLENGFRTLNIPCGLENWPEMAQLKWEEPLNISCLTGRGVSATQSQGGHGLILPLGSSTSENRVCALATNPTKFFWGSWAGIPHREKAVP